MLRKIPLVPLRILGAVAAVAVELVFGFVENLRAGLLRSPEMLIHIVHEHVEALGHLAELARVPRVRLLEACPRREFLERLATCRFVITDSGGVQEEAPYLGTPALIVRTATDRPEAIEAGVARVVGVDAATVVKVVTELLDEPESCSAMARRSATARCSAMGAVIGPKG